jgi:DNA (cytosine-5)-methyltransferase 1
MESLSNMKKITQFVGVDIFAGAGGMSLGAAMAGINVELAVEKDKYAAATYAFNHKFTRLIADDIANVKYIGVPAPNRATILFGGPPCQGFSASNRRTRNSENPANWLFSEFFRVAKLWNPDWIVLENVKGIIETEGGLFRDMIKRELLDLGYSASSGVLCAADFGVPQTRSRLFIIGSKKGIEIEMPKPTKHKPVTVRDAISDLPGLPNGCRKDLLPYKCKPSGDYAKRLRNNREKCNNHMVTRNASCIIERYKHVPQGGNWQDIPANLMTSHKNREGCHSCVYRRLEEDEPSVVIGNYRKNMIIHPWENRGLSVREAARLQSFPDWYEFKGPIGFQQQQVGNAVPPLLAKAVFEAIRKANQD